MVDEQGINLAKDQVKMRRVSGLRISTFCSLLQSRGSRGGSMEGGAAGKTSQESSAHSCDREAVTSEVGH